MLSINAKNLIVINTNQTRQMIQTKVSIMELVKAGSLLHLMFWMVPTGNSFLCLFTVMCQKHAIITRITFSHIHCNAFGLKVFLWLVNTCYPSFIFDKCYNLFQLNYNKDLLSSPLLWNWFDYPTPPAIISHISLACGCINLLFFEKN